MKVLLIGDIHIKKNNFDEIDLLLSNIVNVLNEHNPEKVILLGDILDTHEKLLTPCLNKAYDFINTIRQINGSVVSDRASFAGMVSDRAAIGGRAVYILVGNHDMINASQFLTRNHWMNGLKEWEGVYIIDTTTRVDGFVMLPYVPNGRFIEALDTIENWKDAECIFCHQDFYGCNINDGIISMTGDKWLPEYPDIISGHIHRNQVMKNIYYIGSSIQCKFGESDRNVCVILDSSSDPDCSPFKRRTLTYSITEITLNVTKKKTLNVDIEDIQSSRIEEYAPLDSKDDIKLIVTGNYEQFKTFKKTKKYKELSESVTIVFKHTNMESNHNADGADVENKGFLELLYDNVKFSLLEIAVSTKKDRVVMETYNKIVHNK